MGRAARSPELKATWAGRSPQAWGGGPHLRLTERRVGPAVCGCDLHNPFFIFPLDKWKKKRVKSPARAQPACSLSPEVCSSVPGTHRVVLSNDDIIFHCFHLKEGPALPGVLCWQMAAVCTDGAVVRGLQHLRYKDSLRELGRGLEIRDP